MVLAVTVLMLALSVWPVLNMASGRQLMNAGITPVHLGNSYGAFGSITREREEVVLEGTDDPRRAVTTRTGASTGSAPSPATRTGARRSSRRTTAGWTG